MDIEEKKASQPKENDNPSGLSQGSAIQVLIMVQVAIGIAFLVNSFGTSFLSSVSVELKNFSNYLYLIPTLIFLLAAKKLVALSKPNN